jgi:hypothetical protein
MKKYRFISLETGFKPVDRDTFKEAFADMFKWVKNLLDKNQMTYQILETVIWIETPTGAHLPFYSARDMAIKEGFLVDGKLV